MHLFMRLLVHQDIDRRLEGGVGLIKRPLGRLSMLGLGEVGQACSDGGVVRMHLRRTGPGVTWGHTPLAILAHAVDTRRLVPPTIIVCGSPELDKMQTAGRSEIK